MRVALRTLLVAGVPAIGARWLEPHAATAQTAKPFGIIREGIADRTDAWAGLGTVVTLWPYVARGSFVTADQLAAQIATALHNVRFAEGGVPYLAYHEGTAAEDLFDPNWQALTRPVRVRVFSLAWLAGTTYAPDPVAALNTWTATVIAGAQTNPATWNPQDATPAVYWRLAAPRATEQRCWGAWIDAELRAHVIAPSPLVRATVTRRLVEALAAAHQLALSDGSPLFVREAAGEPAADPFDAGQVRLAARFGVLSAAAVAPALEHAHLSYFRQ